MAQEQLIIAIGRIERVLSRLEQLEIPSSAPGSSTDLQQRHNRLKQDTSKAIRDIDALLQQGA
jgi:hypothetical protein